MGKKWLIGGGVVAVLALTGGVAVMSGAVALPSSGAGKDKKAEAPPLEFVEREVVQPLQARMPTRVTFSGPLVAPRSATVRAKLPGTLLELTVTEGQRVGAGQVIGTIDPAEMQSRRAERAAMVASAQAALAQAERSHGSNERLAAQQFISPVALDQSRAALDAAQAQYRAAQAALQTLQLNLRDATLVAPIGGIVAKRHALPGEKLSVEQPVIAIVDLATLELAGSVGTHEVSRLRPGLPVALKVEGLDAAVPGQLSRIAPAADPGTRSIGVVVVVPNANERLRAGQYAMAAVEIDDQALRLTLPATAIGQAAGQDHVWLIENGVLARRAVTLGRRDLRQGRVEVLQGVEPDSQVLAARFENLREGAQARLVAAKVPSLASAPASAPIVK